MTEELFTVNEGRDVPNTPSKTDLGKDSTPADDISEAQAEGIAKALEAEEDEPEG